MTPLPESDDSDIFVRLAQIEYRLARLESIHARQPIVPGGYHTSEIVDRFKTTIDDLLGTRNEYAENRFNTRREARHDEAKSKARQEEEAKREARHDEMLRKLDLLIELVEKIDWTKYRKLQLEQDNSED